MLMSSRSTSPRCSHLQYHRCGCHRPTSQQRVDDARRLRRHPRRHSSSFQDSDVYHSEVDTRERLLASPNRLLPRSSAEVPVLPPYESVVLSDSSYSHSTTPSCDCGHHIPPTSGFYLQSPPPSYSHPCSRTSQSWRSNEIRSGCERATPCSGGQSSSRYENAHFCYAGHSGGDNLSRDRTSVSSPGVEPATTELSKSSAVA